jgi:hypothetical protein
VFPVATNPVLTEFAGGMAFDGTNYLAGVIYGNGVGGQRVLADGRLSGSPAVVGANPGFPPAVALASAKRNCLVVWSDYSLAAGVTMFGQICTVSGGPAGDKFPLLAAVGSHGFQTVQAAASDGTNYFVVWKDDATGGVYGQRVSGSGALTGSEFLLFTLSEPDSSRNLALAFGEDNYLLAWQDGNNNSNHTFGKLVSMSGAVSGTLQLSTTASLDVNPLAAAFDGTNYFVVWNWDTNYVTGGWPDWNLGGRFVSASGTPQGGELLLLTEQASFPALAFDGDNYLLLWGYDTATTNTDTTIHARFLNRSGAAIGPVFSPFPPHGTNPPLLPLEGAFFDGNQFVLTATYGNFEMNSMGEITGFSGGDVYGVFLPRSTTAPVFENAGMADGLPQLQLRVVPGQSYTIEISTNLATWTAVGVVRSDGTNLLDLVDEEGMGSDNQRYYRALVGDTVGPKYGFQFIEFANGGSFGGGYTPTVAYPVALVSYSALFDVENELDYPQPEEVRFTGPAGSGLFSTPANADNSWIESDYAVYQSPNVGSPPAAPGGTWVVNYRGTNVTFNMADPQAAGRLVILVPTVTVSAGVLQSVSWVYRNASTGAPLSGAPAYVTEVQVEIDGIVGGRLYNSPELTPGTTSHVVGIPVNWSNVTMIHMTYDDTLDNHYVITFSKL